MNEVATCDMCGGSAQPCIRNRGAEPWRVICDLCDVGVGPTGATAEEAMAKWNAEREGAPGKGDEGT